MEGREHYKNPKGVVERGEDLMKIPRLMFFLIFGLLPMPHANGGIGKNHLVIKGHDV